MPLDMMLWAALGAVIGWAIIRLLKTRIKNK